MESLAAIESDVGGDPSRRSGPCETAEVYRVAIRCHVARPGGAVEVREAVHHRWYPFPELASHRTWDGSLVEVEGNDHASYLLWILGGEWITTPGRGLLLRTLRHPDGLAPEGAVTRARQGSPAIGFVPLISAEPTARPRPRLLVEFDSGPIVPKGPTTQAGFEWGDPAPAPRKRGRKGAELPGDAPGWEGVARA